MAGGRRKVGWWIIGAIVAICSVLVIISLVRHGFPTAAPETGPLTATPRLIRLWDAYQQAREAVQAQAADAQLVSASTQWREASEEALLAGTSDWTFVFYSPRSRTVWDVAAGAGMVQVVNQTEVWSAPAPMAQGNWWEGPVDPLLVFLAYGGRAFLEAHPQAVIDLHLAEGSSGGAVWSIVAIDAADSSVFSASIDSETREVLSATP